MEENIKLIGNIDFLDIKVPVYYDKYTKDGTCICSWSSRNPDSFYQGLVFQSFSGKIYYPDDAIIPDQTEKDREMIPKFIIVGKLELDDMIKNISSYLDKDYTRRNGKYKISQI